MDFKKIILGCVTTLLMLGCEHLIRFEENGDDYSGIIINALATPDTIFTASISRSYLFTEVPALNYLDYWEYEAHPDPFYEETILPEAKVELTVNGKDKYIMRYNPAHFNFISDYTPKTGDHIALHVEAEGLNATSGETIIPKVQQLEILSYEKYYEKRELSDEALSDMSQDTVAHIMLRLTDQSNERNYYRLKVRSIAYDKRADNSETILQYSDVYTSSDVIFMDDRLTQGYGGWAAHFSNIFDDVLFDGKEYTFSVKTRLRYGAQPHVVIELQSITHDLYYYLRSMMLYRITDQDAYTESIQIHSNINNGWGIMGGLNAEKHFIYF